MALPDGKGAREYSRFRETRHGRTAVAVTNEDEATPLTLEVTGSGDTVLIPAPGEEENIVVKGFHFSNDGNKLVASLKAGTDGKKKFSTSLTANGGSLDKNLIGRYWRLPINKALIVNLSGAGTVYVTVETEAGDEPAEEAVTPSDALSIAEAIAIESVKAITDSQSIAEGISKLVITVGLTESLSIAEALANQNTLSMSDSLSIAESEIESVGTGGLADSISISEALTLTAVKAPADSLSIAEAVGNGVTLSLSDSVSMDDSPVVIVHTPGP